MPGRKSDPRQTTEVDVKIGARIRARRVELRLSQEALAEQIGVTFQQIQKYEGGRNRVSASMLMAVAKALKTNVSTLLPGNDKAVMVHRGEFERLVGLYSKLSDAGRSALLASAEGLVSAFGRGQRV